MGWDGMGQALLASFVIVRGGEMRGEEKRRKEHLRGGGCKNKGSAGWGEFSGR